VLLQAVIPPERRNQGEKKNRKRKDKNELLKPQLANSSTKEDI